MGCHGGTISLDIPARLRDAAMSRPRQGRSLISRRVASVGLVLAMLTGIGLGRRVRLADLADPESAIRCALGRRLQGFPHP